MKTITVSILLMLTLNVPAICQSSNYFGSSIGISQFDDVSGKDSSGIKISSDIEPGYMIGAEVGRWDHDGRMGLEINFRGSSIDHLSLLGVTVPSDGDVKMISLMGTFMRYLNTDTDDVIRPYIGAGLGMSYMDVDLGFGISDDDTVFTWQINLGAEFGNPNNGPIVFVGYELMGTEDINIEGTNVGDILIHNIEFGVRFNF